MNIAFEWPEVRDKLIPNMKIAISFGDSETAGSIAATIVSAYRSIQRLTAGESRSEVIEYHVQKQQMLYDYFNSPPCDTISAS